MKKKILRSLILIGLVVVCVGQAVYAASPSIYFSLPNTGTVFTVCDTSSNYKAYLTNEFSVKLTICDLSPNTGGYGFCFKPLYEANGSGNGWYSAGIGRWLNSTGIWKYGTYTYADHINYKLGGRIDDTYSGWCDAEGNWNADHVD